MKKSLIFGLLASLTATASFGQGQIWLDNYFEAGAQHITYGTTGIPANGVSGPSGTVGAGLQTGWTAGFYFALGDITGSIGSDGTLNSTGLPSDQNVSFILATGAGSTAALNNFNTPGAFTSAANFSSPFAAGTSITVEIIAYSGSSYTNSLYRGHSAAFTMVVTDPSSAVARVGDSMPAFSVSNVPEPSVCAMAVISGGSALMYLRRRKKNSR